MRSSGTVHVLLRIAHARAAPDTRSVSTPVDAAGLSYGFSTRAGGGGGGDSGLSAYADSKRLDAGAGASSS